MEVNKLTLKEPSVLLEEVKLMFCNNTWAISLVSTTASILLVEKFRQVVAHKVQQQWTKSENQCFTSARTQVEREDGLKLVRRKYVQATIFLSAV